MATPLASFYPDLFTAKDQSNKMNIPSDSPKELWFDPGNNPFFKRIIDCNLKEHYLEGLQIVSILLLSKIKDRDTRYKLHLIALCFQNQLGAHEAVLSKIPSITAKKIHPLFQTQFIAEFIFAAIKLKNLNLAYQLAYNILIQPQGDQTLVVRTYIFAATIFLAEQKPEPILQLFVEAVESSKPLLEKYKDQFRELKEAALRMIKSKEEQQHLKLLHQALNYFNQNLYTACFTILNSLKQPDPQSFILLVPCLVHLNQLKEAHKIFKKEVKNSLFKEALALGYITALIELNYIDKAHKLIKSLKETVLSDEAQKKLKFLKISLLLRQDDPLSALQLATEALKQEPRTQEYQSKLMDLIAEINRKLIKEEIHSQSEN